MLKRLILKNISTPPPYRLIFGRLLPFLLLTPPSPPRGEGVRGRSMIEMLGVLAIIGVLSAGGIMGYNLAMEEHKINKFAQDMSTIAANAINVLGNSKNMGNDAIRAPELCQAKIIPAEHCKNLTIKAGFSYTTSPWGGDMAIRIFANNNQPEYLSVWTWLQPTYKDAMPQKACVKLATMKWTGFKKVTLYTYHSSSVGKVLVLPVSTAVAKKWCYDTKGSSSQVALSFLF